MTTKYAPMFIIRFRGIMTQGPNSGKSYDFANSWGGVFKATEQEGRELLASYRAMEPAMDYRLISRVFVQDGRTARFLETDLAL